MIAQLIVPVDGGVDMVATLDDDLEWRADRPSLEFWLAEFGELYDDVHAPNPAAGRVRAAAAATGGSIQWDESVLNTQWPRDVEH